MIHQEFARDRSVVPRYIYIGRLVQEKGFDIVIDTAKGILESPSLPALLEIYGNGPMKARLLLTLSRFPYFFDASEGDTIPPGARVVYFGHVGSEKLKQALGRSHYMLMPSRFLETFGLSALEAIESGVPVIGFDHGGLGQFLLSEHRVVASGNLLERYKQIIENVNSHFSGASWRRQSLSVQDVAARYTKKNWLENLKKHIPADAKKILIASDYGAPIGGLETHIHSVIALLRQEGYEVTFLYGANGNNRNIRYLLLLFSWINFPYALRLWRAISTFQPDIIWLHSEVRCIGPLGLLPLKWFTGKLWKTYHDLAYFGAFPTEFTRESELVGTFSFSQFFARSRSVTRYFFFHILAKYIQIRLLQKYLVKGDLHIVPSDFMKPVVSDFIGKEERVAVIAHFSPHNR